MPKSVEERRKETTQEARQLAESQGVNWKELPQEQRREFKQQVRQNRAANREARKSGGATKA